MIRALRIETVRGRLTLFYVLVLATVLAIVGGLIYLLLAQALYSRIDDNLTAVVQIARTSLANDLAEGQDEADAAASTAAELASRQQMLAIYDPNGSLLAERGRDDDLHIVLPDADAIPVDDVMLVTVAEFEDPDDRHRLAIRRVPIAGHETEFVVVVGGSLEPTDEELESLRAILAYVVPIALALAGAGGWFLARQSLSPVGAMAERAKRIGAQDLTARLPVMNPRDELGRLAQAFNDLLGRLEISLLHQRQFMADASHELRTPVATARTAATVALQHAHRDETEYREALAIVEGQTVRLSRIVEDMFTLARADAGDYPLRRSAMYLNDVVAEVVRAARVMAAGRQVSIAYTTVDTGLFTGDEDLIRRLLGNLIDNAVRHAPAATAVRVGLTNLPGAFAITVTDEGPGIPADVREHIFERFYRGDTARSRADGGAGLGLALARWIASVHGGHISLTDSAARGSTFTVVLPVTPQ